MQIFGQIGKHHRYINITYIWPSIYIWRQIYLIKGKQPLYLELFENICSAIYNLSWFLAVHIFLTLCIKMCVFTICNICNISNIIKMCVFNICKFPIAGSPMAHGKQSESQVGESKAGKRIGAGSKSLNFLITKSINSKV